MDPDSSEDPFANSAAGGGDEFMAVNHALVLFNTFTRKLNKFLELMVRERPVKRKRSTSSVRSSWHAS